MGMAGYTDADAISAWAREGIEWAVLIGIIQGSGGELKPQSQCTRAEAAQMLMRFVESFKK